PLFVVGGLARHLVGLFRLLGGRDVEQLLEGQPDRREVDLLRLRAERPAHVAHQSLAQPLVLAQRRSQTLLEHEGLLEQRLRVEFGSHHRVAHDHRFDAGRKLVSRVLGFLRQLARSYQTRRWKREGSSPPSRSIRSSARIVTGPRALSRGQANVPFSSRRASSQNPPRSKHKTLIRLRAPLQKTKTSPDSGSSPITRRTTSASVT